MAFPAIASTTTTLTATEVTTHTGNYPATVNADDLLVLLYASGWGGGTVTTPTGYDGTIKFDASNGTSSRLSGFVKKAAGTEGGGTVDVVTSDAAQGIIRIFRITGWYNTLSGGVEFGTAATGNDASPDSPNLAPAWGSADNLWIAAHGTRGLTADTTAYPSGYSGGTYSENAAENGSACGMGSAYKQATAASENPGVFTNANSAYWVAQTIAIRPSAGGGGGGGGSGNNSGADTSPAMPAASLTVIPRRIMGGSSI